MSNAAMKVFGDRRWRQFLQTQLPFMVGIALVTGLAASAWPACLATPPFVVGLALIVVAVGLFVAIPRSASSQRWLLLVPCVDLIGIALVSDALIEVLPAALCLAIFPVAWLAYGFPPFATYIAIGLSFLGSFAPTSLTGWRVELDHQWRNDLLLAGVATIVALTVRVAATRFAAHERELLDSRRQLQKALTQADVTASAAHAAAEAAGVAVGFYAPDGSAVFRNTATWEMYERANYDTETNAGGLVFAADKRTPLAPEEQFVPRVLRGDDLASLLYWVGPEHDRRAILNSARRVYGPSGEFVGTVIIATDVSEMAHAVEMRDTFMASVSHELRTPLTSVIGFLDVIDDLYDIDAQPFGRELRTVQRSSEQLFTLIGDLLTAAPADLRLRIDRVNVSNLVVETMQASCPRARSAQLAFGSTIAQDLHAEVDAARVRQVLDNLLTNAIKYTPAGGRIHVDLHEERGMLVLTVSDTGKGISLGDQQRLFERFFRAQSARENAVQGVGLGLSIVKAIADAHNATITIDSELGHGSAFALRLPAHRKSPERAGTGELAARS